MNLMQDLDARLAAYAPTDADAAEVTEQEKVREAFLAAFPKARLADINLEKYCIGRGGQGEPLLVGRERHDGNLQVFPWFVEKLRYFLEQGKQRISFLRGSADIPRAKPESRSRDGFTGGHHQAIGQIH